MPTPIDNAFIKQYESEVKTAYQRMGSKLSNTVRKKNDITGASTTFQVVGKGTAGKKSRHGKVPTMNIDHTPVECTLEDWYAGDFIDKLDELKTNIDERKVVTDAGAAALGRRADQILVDAITSNTTNVHTAAGGTGLTQTKINTVFEYFGNKEIPDDGQRYWVISPEGWTDLLGINAFSNADYVGSDDLPYTGGMTAKRWMSFMWFTFSGLNDGAGGDTEAKTMAYHHTAVGMASGAEVSTTLSWENTHAAHFAQSNMSMGAVVIDGEGVYNVDIVK